MGLSFPATVPPAQNHVDTSPILAANHPRPHAATRFIDSDSNREGIDYISSNVDRLSSIDKQLDKVKGQYDPKWLGDQERKLSGLKLLRDKTIFENQQLLKQLPIVRQNFVVATVEAFVWKTYNDHVAIAEIKHFYDLNRSWYQFTSGMLSDDSVKRSAEAGKAGLDLLSEKAQGMKEFMDVQKRTLGLIESTTNFMLEAPQISALATPEETRSFLAKIDDNNSKYWLAVMEDTKRSLEPYPPFAEAVRDAYVPGLYRGIARNLGLDN